jgi:hypothetical protein
MGKLLLHFTVDEIGGMNNRQLGQVAGFLGASERQLDGNGLLKANLDDIKEHVGNNMARLRDVMLEHPATFLDQLTQRPDAIAVGGVFCATASAAPALTDVQKLLSVEATPTEQPRSPRSVLPTTPATPRPTKPMES